MDNNTPALRDRIPPQTYGAIGQWYFAEQTCLLLPTVIEIRILEQLATDAAHTLSCASQLAETLDISPIHVRRAAERLSQTDLAITSPAGEDLEIRLLPHGRRYYQDFLDTDRLNSEACIQRLQRALRCVAQEALDLFTKTEMWLKARSANELVAFLGGDDDILANAGSLCPALEAVRRVRLRSDKPVSPLYLRALGHLVSAFAAEAWPGYRHAPEKELRVLVDTNVLMRLVEGSSDHNAPRSTLERVIRDAPATEFLISEVTLEELRGVLEAIRCSCQAWELRGTSAPERRLHDLFVRLRQAGEKPVPAEHIEAMVKEAYLGGEEAEEQEVEAALRELTPLGADYFVREDSPPTLRDYVDLRVRQIVGLSPLSAMVRNWAPLLVNTRDTICTDDVGLVLGELRAEGDWPPRSDFTECHDIELLLYAQHMNSIDKQFTYVVWTHHTRLSALAVHIKVDPNVVVFGPGLHAAVPQHAESLRDYLRYVFLRQDAELVESMKELKRSLRAASASKDSGTLAEVMGRVFGLMRAPRQRELDAELPEPAEADPEMVLPSVAAIPLALTAFERISEGGWTDLSMDWGESPGGHGAQPLRIYWCGGPRKWQSGAMQWHLSPHTVTHVDLPWALDELPLLSATEARANWPSQEAQEYIGELLRPRPLNTVFVRLTDCVKHMRSAGSPAGSESLAELSEEEFVALIAKLRVTRDLLADRIPDSSDIAGALVVLHTGWASTFCPKGDDLSSLVWEGTHPWLVHPWLDPEAVVYLLGRGVAGVAIDAPMPDCPMYIVANIVPQRPEMRRVARIIFETGFDGMRLPRRQPAHEKLLCNFKMLAESLDIPTSVEGWYPADSSHFHTKCFVCGFHLHVLPDAAPIKLLAQDPRMNTQEHDQ